MKKGFFLVFLVLAFSPFVQSQKLTFSEYNKKEGRNTNFEILGKFDSSFLVYKGINKKHYITIYNDDMKIAKHKWLDFIPEKTFNIDFITYPRFFYMIFQYQRNNVIYCYAVKINADAEVIDEPVLLESTRIGFFADHRIYAVSFSENKEKILVYKRQVRQDNLTVATRLFDVNLKQIDSTMQVIKYDDRRDFYSEIVVNNDGHFIFSRGTGKNNRGSSNTIHVLVHKPGMDTFRFFNISLNEKYINEVDIRADNLNKHYIINAFYQGKRNRMVEGLFTTIIDMKGERSLNAVFNTFSDSLRNAINPGDKSSFSFDNLTIKNAILKRKGGFILSAEDFYSETQFNNIWNRNYMFNNNFYSGTTNDYFLNSPYYYYGYRPWNNSSRDQNIRYYYNDIVILSLDSTLKLEWNNVIHKKQYDVDNENFLSFSTMNAGGEIRFLFIEKDNRKQIISNQAISPSGQIKRYPTIKSNETGYGFMPRLAKQVGARQVIIPYVYLGYIAFSKIDFFD